MRYRVSTRFGMTLVEVVLALVVLGMLLPILYSVLSLTAKVDYHWTARQNQLGILQLRRKIAQGVEMKLEASQLSFIFNDQQVTLVCDNGMVLQQPGSMPYLLGLSACRWSRHHELIILTFTEGELTHEIIVGLWA